MTKKNYSVIIFGMKRFIKKSLIAVVLLFTGFLGFSQEYDIYKSAPSEVKKRIAKAEELILKRQYLSAHNALGADDNEYIIYRRSSLFTQYFAKSLNHKMFVLLDLKEGENLEDLRSNDSEFSGHLIMYDVEKIIKNFEEKNGKKAIFDLTLGNYYDAVARCYGDGWFISYNDLVSKSQEHLLKAEKAGLYDEVSLITFGTIYFNEQKYEKSVEVLKKCLALNEKNTFALYNIAVTYAQLKKYNDAVTALEKAIKYENNPAILEREYGFLSQCYVNLDNPQKAISTLKTGKSKIKKSGRLCYTLGTIYYYFNKDYKAAEKEFLEAVSYDVAKVEEIFDYIANYRDWNNFIAFGKKALQLYPKDDYYQGFVHYMIAQGYLCLSDYQNCMKEVQKAEEKLRKADALHYFANDINQMKQMCEEN